MSESGPVITTSQIAAVYDTIAPHWHAPGFNMENGIAQHRRALRFARPSGGPALDVGCGCTGRFIDLLASAGFDVEGLDISQEMLALARKRHPTVRFHHADICTWALPHSYAFITAWDSIWHVPLALQAGVLRKLMRGLAPGGVIIFSAGGLEAPHEVTNPCHGEPLYHATLGMPAILRIMGEAGCAVTHVEYDQHPESHVFVIGRRHDGLGERA